MSLSLSPCGGINWPGKTLHILESMPDLAPRLRKQGGMKVWFPTLATLLVNCWTWWHGCEHSHPSLQRRCIFFFSLCMTRTLPWFSKREEAIEMQCKTRRQWESWRPKGFNFLHCLAVKDRLSLSPPQRTHSSVWHQVCRKTFNCVLSTPQGSCCSRNDGSASVITKDAGVTIVHQVDPRTDK